MGEKIKFNIPPEHSRFKKCQSGNAAGARRTKPAETVGEAIMRKVREPITNPVTRRGRTNRYHLGARSLVIQAAKGDRRAITEVVKLSKKASRNGHTWRKVSFRNASQKDWSTLTPEFYEKQAKDKAELRRQAREEVTFADEVGVELRKRVKMPIGDKVVRMSMQDVIAHNLANDVAKGDISAITLLEKIAPSKSSSQRKVFTEVAKPNAEEKAWLDRQQGAYRENLREAFRELYPDQDWDDDAILDIKIREWRGKKAK